MDIKQLHNNNLGKLPNEYGNVSVMKLGGGCLLEHGHLLEFL